jgi:hypothetical protein
MVGVQCIVGNLVTAPLRVSAMKPSKKRQRACRLHRLPGTVTLVVGTVAVAWAEHGCLIDEKCYADVDCPPFEVCGTNGKCEFQCRADGDCDRAFGVAYVCRESRCIQPVECTLCAFPHAQALCVHGVCQRGDCNPGFHDVNGDARDGCEYPCVRSGPEVCDRVDNDCDGLMDENTDFGKDVLNCGRCGNACTSPPHSDPVCSFGQCKYTCHAGYYDNNGHVEDGCESTGCDPSEEICDGRDNDCDCLGDSNQDGVFCGPGDSGVDEGFEKSLVTSCGPFCTVCSYPNAQASCISGACQMGACDVGWHDADGLEVTGCEYVCTPSGEEKCDAADNDCDGEVDEGEVCGRSCPPDMVTVGSAYCVDRYEASRRDATAFDQGQDGSIALSRPGVLPWMVNPMSAAHLDEFQAACQAAGKHLCSREEWFAACTGPAQTSYVYGSVFNRETCNCVDTYCDDHCAENGIDPALCRLTADCGYTYYCFRVMPTAQFATCTNEYGTLDMNGNVWEIVPSSSDPRGYEIRGGAFNCASAVTRVNCSYNAGWLDLYAGFRCCKELP